MCIIIDTNTLSPVFSKSDPLNSDFHLVLEWVTDGRGKIVIGGSKYKSELRGSKKYLSIISQLEKRGKVVFVDDGEVDAAQKIVEGLISHTDFDDQHLVALIRVSKCKIICSIDKRAYPFFRNGSLYESAKHKPKIYSQKKSGQKLLIDQNIAAVCRAC